MFGKGNCCSSKRVLENRPELQGEGKESSSGEWPVTGTWHLSGCCGEDSPFPLGQPCFAGTRWLLMGHWAHWLLQWERTWQL